MKYILLLSLLFSCTKKENLIAISGKTMGTTYSIKAYTDVSNEQVKSAVDKLLRDYNQIFSTYIKTSELVQLNQASLNDQHQISYDLFKVLKLSKHIFNKTNGHYDVTIGPLVNRWGFGPIKEKGKPSKKEVKELLKKSGSNFELIAPYYIKKRKNMFIDLSSIAKGDGVDKVAYLLKDKFQVKSFFVEIGGEVFAMGKKADGSSWKVGVEKPSLLKGQGGLQRVIELNKEAIATSGSYRNFIKYGDKVFSHTIDPKTGYPVDHKTISVSVISKTCALADAWATALMSLGHTKGIQVAKKEGLKVIFLVKQDEIIKEISTF
ncbi:MAG: FAD:protein FMN transferase [Bacteriovoracaceae bacterium]|jgi:thiamine biosynthesis lipoprotein|nr:FAD:protein FMN transferase [Bacteriovoracaceae bacterium]